MMIINDIYIKNINNETNNNKIDLKYCIINKNK